MQHGEILKAVEKELGRLRRVLRILQVSTTDIFYPSTSLPKKQLGQQAAASDALKASQTWALSEEATRQAAAWAGTFQPWVATGKAPVQENAGPDKAVLPEHEE